MPPSPFRLGIVGTGLIAAGSHLPAALGCPEVHVVALVDPVIPRAAALARQMGISPMIAPRVDEVLPAVDGVIVASPNATHLEIALRCIDAGVHVLIEKPLATTSAEGMEIVSAAERKAVVAAVGFCTRFRPNVELLKKLLDEAYFGPVRRFVHQFGTAGGWAPLSAYNLDTRQAGGGVLVVTATHFLDRMLYLWGFPDTATLTDDGHGGPEANCTAHFGFDGYDGIARYSKTGRLPAGLVIEAARGEVVLGDTDDAPIRFYPRDHAGLCETLAAAEGGPLDGADVFQLQLLDFVDACRNGRRPRVDGRQAVDSLRLVEMLYANRTVPEERWYDEPRAA